MNKEEYLQDQIERGKVDNSTDSLAYQKVFNALKKETASGLSPDFADRVLSIVPGHKTATSHLELLLAVIGGTFTIVMLIVAVMLTGFKLDLGILKSASSFRGVLFFGAGFILLLNWIDKLVVRKKDTV
jgi:hypothetical protein